MIDEVMPK